MARHDDLNTVVARFILELLTLKTTPRSGWARVGVHLGAQETVAQHTFGSQAIGFVLAVLAEADAGRVAILTALHDITETRTQDISLPLRNLLEGLGLPKELVDQRAEEEQGANLPLELQKSLASALHEYREQETLEARVAYDAQLLDLGIQAFRYQKQGYPTQGFTKEIAQRLHTQFGKALWSVISRNPELFDDWFSTQGTH